MHACPAFCSRAAATRPAVRRSCSRRPCSGRAHDDRVLATQLQRDRGEVGGRGRHHLAAHGGRPREEQVVEIERGELLAHLGVTGDDGDLLDVEHVVPGVRQHLGGPRHPLRHLDHHAVAGGQCRDRRRRGEREREVPHPHHADDAERARLHLGAQSSESQHGSAQDAPRRARSHPARDPSTLDLRLGAEREDVVDERRHLAPEAEVGRDGVDDRIRVVQHRVREPVDPISPECQRRRAVAVERRPLQGEHLRHRGRDRRGAHPRHLGSEVAPHALGRMLRWVLHMGSTVGTLAGW